MSSNPSSEIHSNADIALCLSVVMPVFNEVTTAAQVVERVLRQRPVLEVVVVDDGSCDGTWDALQKIASTDPRVRLFRHDKNRGKGAALRTAFERAVGSYVVVQDADHEYDPAEYYLLLRPVLAGQADVVFGSRFLRRDTPQVVYFWHLIGNAMLTTLSNLVTNLNLTDMETGYKLFRRELLGRVTLREDGFGFEPEITAKFSRLNVRFHEVAISYSARSYAQGKKISWRDGFRALWCICKYKFFAARDIQPTY